MRRAWDCDWSDAVDGLVPARNLCVIGRGLGLAAAQEAALKSGDLRPARRGLQRSRGQHGPMALVGEGFPVLVLARPNATLDGTRALVAEFRARGARWAAPGPEGNLPVAAPPHPACAPLLLVQSFYRMANALAIAAATTGPAAALNKVTETV